MAIQPFPLLPIHYHDDNGNLLAGGKLYFYEAGTPDTVKPVYTDHTGATEYTQPVVLNVRGEPPTEGVYGSSSVSYKIVLKTASGVTIKTIDGFAFPSGGGGGGGLEFVSVDSTLSGDGTPAIPLSVENSPLFGGHLPSHFAVDSDVVHIAGDETITGQKTFDQPIILTETTLDLLAPPGTIQYDGLNFYISVNNIPANYFMDARDSELYRFVTIGSQIWMAENLRGNFGSNHIYDADPLYLPTLGRLYDYTTAQASAPTGWHFPTPSEWNVMTTFVGLTDAGKKLKASNALWLTNTGTDDYDFTYLPGGYWDYNGFYSTLGNFGFVWLESGVAGALNSSSYMSASNDIVSYLSQDNRNNLSVRYIKD